MPRATKTTPLIDDDLPAPKVDFLCIGAQKGGTTWLHEHLCHHSEVCLSPVKEVHYFNYLYSLPDRVWILDHYVRPARAYLQKALEDPFNIDWRRIAYYADVVIRLESGQIDEDWYHHIFSLCERKKHLRGDITPAYLALPTEGIAAVKSYNPDMRLIALLRDPVDRALSAARMMLKRKRLSDPTDDDWRNILKGHGILGKSRYSSQLERWLQMFSYDQFLILPYEQIAAEPHIVIDRICAFLGIAKIAENETLADRVHAGVQYPAPKWVCEHLESQLAPERARTGELFPVVAAWWGEPVKNLNADEKISN